MNTGELLIIVNAIVLGFRHAIDWDHVAALMDISASSALVTSEGTTVDSGRRYALWLSCLYGLGHCLVVVLIGMVTCYCAGFVPAWFDHLMGKYVGATLLAFGIVVGFISLKNICYGSPAVQLAARKLYCWD